MAQMNGRRGQLVRTHATSLAEQQERQNRPSSKLLSKDSISGGAWWRRQRGSGRRRWRISQAREAKQAELKAALEGFNIRR